MVTRLDIPRSPAVADMGREVAGPGSNRAPQTGRLGDQAVAPGAGARLQAPPSTAAQAWQSFKDSVVSVMQRIGDTVSSMVLGSPAQRADRAADQLAKALRGQEFDQSSLTALTDLLRHCKQAEPRLFAMALLRDKLGDTPVPARSREQVDAVLHKLTGLDQARVKSVELRAALHANNLGPAVDPKELASMREPSAVTTAVKSLREAMAPAVLGARGNNESAGFSNVLGAIKARGQSDPVPTSDINRFNRDMTVRASPGLSQPDEQQALEPNFAKYLMMPAASFEFAQVSQLETRGLADLTAMCVQGSTRAERMAAGTRMQGLVGTPALSAEQQAMKLLQAVPGPQRQKVLNDLATTPISELTAQLRALKPGLANAHATKVAQALVQGSLRLLSGSNQVLSQTETQTLGYPTAVQFDGKRFDHARVLGAGGANGLGHLFRSADGSTIVLKQAKLALGETADRELLDKIQNEIRVHQHAMGGAEQAPGRENVVALRGLITMPAGEQTARRFDYRLPDDRDFRSDLERLGETFIVTDAAMGGEMAELMSTLETLRPQGAIGVPGVPTISPSVQDLVARSLFAQLIDGMAYLQADRQIIHHDLKPENILMSADGSVKIIDFGNSSLGGDVGNQGSPLYMSPEAIGTGAALPSGIGAATDTWSLGVLFQRLMINAQVALAGANTADAVDSATAAGLSFSDMGLARRSESELEFAQIAQAADAFVSDDLPEPAAVALEAATKAWEEAESHLIRAREAVDQPSRAAAWEAVAQAWETAGRSLVEARRAGDPSDAELSLAATQAAWQATAVARRVSAAADDPQFINSPVEPRDVHAIRNMLSALTPSDQAYVSRPAMGGFRELLNSMLSADPAARPDLRAVQQHHVVSDPMLRDSNVQALIRLLVAPGDLASKAPQIETLNRLIETAASQGRPAN